MAQPKWAQTNSYLPAHNPRCQFIAYRHFISLKLYSIVTQELLLCNQCTRCDPLNAKYIKQLKITVHSSQTRDLGLLTSGLNCSVNASKINCRLEPLRTCACGVLVCQWAGKALTRSDAKVTHLSHGLYTQAHFNRWPLKLEPQSNCLQGECACGG